MYLVLADPSDTSAAWAYQQLRARGEQAELMTPHELATLARYDHRVGQAGSTISIRLRRGLVIEGDKVRGVLNRIAYLPPALFSHLRSPDRLYATQEVAALLFSWLQGLAAPVLNKPTLQGLGGAWRHPSEWTRLATLSGFATRPFRQDSRKALPPDANAGSALTCLLVIGGAVIPINYPSAVTLEAAEAAAELSRLSATPILGVYFNEYLGALTFAWASPRPDFQLAGAAAIEALLGAWGGDRQ